MSEARRHHPGLNLGGTDPDNHEAAEEVIFGFWVFLMSDAVLFALLLNSYAALSRHGIADGPAPGDLFALRPVLIETLLLLASSFTFGMASLMLKYRQDTTRLVLWLAATFALGAAFVALELKDFHSFIVQHDAPPQRSAFLSAFYLLVGTHMAHVLAGLVWMIVIFVQIRTFGLVRDVKLRVMRLALFWHMLDVVWVAIFTFVFLLGVAP